MLDISLGGCCLILRDSPEAGRRVAVGINLGRSGARHFIPIMLLGRIVSTRPRDGRMQCAIEFATDQDDKKSLLKKAIFSDAYIDIGGDEQARSSRSFWGVSQWAAYLTGQRLPVLPFSQRLLATINQEQSEDALSLADLAGIAVNDPFLVLMLLRQAEMRKASNLAHGISTVLGGIMYLGINGVSRAIQDSPEADDTNMPLIRSIETSIMASRLARGWANCRHDINADEVVLAALLADIGEQLLWHFAPELAQGALDAMQLKNFPSPGNAQKATCGFQFRDLTLACARHWQLPGVLSQLIQGTESPRAAIPRLAVSVAGHIMHDRPHALIMDDMKALARYLPMAAPQTLLKVLNDVAGIQCDAASGNIAA